MNATQHRLTAAWVLAAAGGVSTEDPQERLRRCALGAVGGYCCGTVPDLIEPATCPHHRQFFHSIAFGLLVGYGMSRVWRWEPETSGGELVRALALVAGGAYLVHLLLDATTPRSLPLLGRVS